MRVVQVEGVRVEKECEKKKREAVRVENECA